MVWRRRPEEHARDPRLLGRPCEDEVGEFAAEPLGLQPDGVDEVKVACELLAVEHRILVTAVGRWKDLSAVHAAGQQPLHQRPVDDHCHAMIGAPRENLLLDFPLEHVEVHLAVGQRALGHETREVVDRATRETDGAGRAGVEQSLQCASRVLDGNRGIRGVEIEQIEVVGPQPVEALRDFSTKPLRTSVRRLLSRRSRHGGLFPVDATLAGNHDGITTIRHGFANRPFALAVLAVARCVMPASIAIRIVATAASCVTPPRVIPASGQQPRPSGPTTTGDGPRRRAVVSMQTVPGKRPVGLAEAIWMRCQAPRSRRWRGSWR
jgi:hypothetical protein